MSKWETLLKENLAPLAEKQGVLLVDVELRSEGGRTFLRIFLDHELGMNIEKCEAFHRAALKEGFMEDVPYDYFEVSSRGDRVLKTEADFAFYLNKDVELKLYAQVDGQKTLQGKLLFVTDEEIGLLVENGEKSFAKEQVASVKPHFVLFNESLKKRR